MTKETKYEWGEGVFTLLSWFKKEKVNWYDACSMISSMGYIKCTDTYAAYEERIKPYVNIKSLKNKVSKHSKKEGVKFAAA